MANERARSEFPSQTILRRKLIAVGAPRLNGLRQSGGRDDVGTADKQQTDDAFSGGILRPHLRQNVTDLRIRLRKFVTQTASAVMRDFEVASG